MLPFFTRTTCETQIIPRINMDQQGFSVFTLLLSHSVRTLPVSRYSRVFAQERNPSKYHFA